MSIIWGEIEPNFKGVEPCDGNRMVKIQRNDGIEMVGKARDFVWYTEGKWAIRSYQLEVLPFQEVAEVTEEEEEAFREIEKRQKDDVNHPSHYTAHPSGIECIQITEHMGFNLGNAIKYIWRCDLKKDAIKDLLKAKFYIEREIAKRANL